MRRISASDAVFLDMEKPNAPLIIGGLFVLDPSTAPGNFVRHRDILDYVESRLHLMANLRRKLVYHPLGLDEPRLIDDPDFEPVPPEKRWVPDRKPDALGWTVNSLQEGAKQWVANLKAMPGLRKGMLASARTSAGGLRDKG